MRVRVRVSVRVQVLPRLDAKPRLEQRLHGGGRLESHLLTYTYLLLTHLEYVLTY